MTSKFFISSRAYINTYGDHERASVEENEDHEFVEPAKGVYYGGRRHWRLSRYNPLKFEFDQKRQ